MKVLVTGANGYLGQGLVKNILNKGHSVVAVDFSDNYIDDKAVKKSCNLFEVVNPYDIFERPDILLHLAWRDGFAHNSEAHIKDIPKHYDFLKKMMKSGIKRVVVMGSMHEIGLFEGSIKENTPCHPMSLYGIAKDALRNMVQLLAAQYKTQFQWLRGFYIVGNTSLGGSIFSQITLAAQEGKKNFPFTMGQNQYDFIDFNNFCDQVASVVGQNEVLGIINICSGKPEKLADRVERFIKENNYSINLQYGAYPDRAYDSKAVWGDNEKIQRILEMK